MRYFKILKTLLSGARLAHSIRIDIILFGKIRILQFGVRAPNYIECGDSAKISKIRRPTNTYADHNITIPAKHSQDVSLTCSVHPYVLLTGRRPQDHPSMASTYSVAPALVSNATFSKSQIFVGAAFA
jgi:hypothetical protein